MEENRQLVREVTDQVNWVILGKKKEVEEIMLSFLAGGHVLLEDIPGVGKTTMALAFSRAMDLEYRRIQFTPDVLPSDLTGFSIYRRETESFVYQQGSVFCNLLLADEINRTSPKTQSALLEVMEERKVTVEGVTRSVPEPFLVIATQNPSGAVGTQLLPEAQVDRFMICLSIGYPDFDSELAMALGISKDRCLDSVERVIDAKTLSGLQREVGSVYLKEEVGGYIVNLVRATRQSPYLERGGSPRATVALVKMAKASAWMDGRDYVMPKDAEEQFPFVMRHRMVRNDSAAMEGIAKAEILSRIAGEVEKPRMGRRFPAGFGEKQSKERR